MEFDHKFGTFFISASSKQINELIAVISDEATKDRLLKVCCDNNGYNLLDVLIENRLTMDKSLFEFVKQAYIEQSDFNHLEDKSPELIAKIVDFALDLDDVDFASIVFDERPDCRASCAKQFRRFEAMTGARESASLSISDSSDRLALDDAKPLSGAISMASSGSYPDDGDGGLETFQQQKKRELTRKDKGMLSGQGRDYSL